MIIIINEYLLIFSNGSDIYRIYGHDETQAINTFLLASAKYSETTSEDFKEYWENLQSQIRDKNYTVIQNEDFLGIRRIV